MGGVWAIRNHFLGFRFGGCDIMFKWFSSPFFCSGQLGVGSSPLILFLLEI